MRVYIRTSNQNTNGIIFHNGQTWEQEHTHCQGFTYKPAKKPTRRYEFKPPMKRDIAYRRYTERSLAVLVLAEDTLTEYLLGGGSSNENLKTVTWIREDTCTTVEILDLYGLSAETLTVEEALDEVKYQIYRYLSLSGEPETAKIRITKKDISKVSYDNGRHHWSRVMPEIEPQGFSITTRRGVKHYTIPDYLSHSVYNANGEQRSIVYAALAWEKLKNIPGETLITGIEVTRNAAHKSFHGKRAIKYLDIKPDNPVPENELRKQIASIVLATTKG